jgi:localization factor PodJL
MSTRELIEQARAAAREAALAADPKTRKGRAAGGGGLPNLSLGRPSKAKRRSPSALAAALMVSGGAAVIGMGAAGYVLFAGHPSGVLPPRVMAALGLEAAKPAARAAAPAAPSTAPTDAVAAVALAPQPPEEAGSAAAAPAASAVAAGADSGAELYGDAVRRIEARDLTGLNGLRKAANLGYAPAEFYLAKLYETGEAGLKKDLGEARRWTERAAEAGDRKAMHNLALYYVEGSGGTKNTTTAAQWFRRAADLGLVDSQYNLGRLYEEGFGVAQNPAEAYKWYLIAAHAGDAESRASAQRLKGQLSAEAQAAAERAAGSFQAQQSHPASTQMAQAATGGDLAGAAIAQRALTRLGYYQGPTDGSPSAALKLAIQAYQRDQGLPATGVPDAALSQRLAVIAQ